MASRNYVAPRQEYPARAARDELRARELARTPRWYSPYAHLAIPSAFALAVIGLTLAMLRGPSAPALLVVPAVWVLSNANEWHIHRGLLHRRSALAPILYDRHTPVHHMIYVTDEMAMRDVREWRLVLIPAYGLFLIFVTLLPLTAAIWLAGFRNVALLYLATAMFYAASYEWLHLCYHLPRQSRIGRLAVIGRLRRHHAIHHDPRLMQRYNFNVTMPLWDWMRGTLVRDRESVLGAAGVADPLARSSRQAPPPPSHSEISRRSAG